MTIIEEKSGFIATFLRTIGAIILALAVIGVLYGFIYQLVNVSFTFGGFFRLLLDYILILLPYVAVYAILYALSVIVEASVQTAVYTKRYVNRDLDNSNK